MLWAIFISIQTIRHRDYFIPVENASDPEVDAEPPTTEQAWASFGLLLLCLVTVVGLAKMLSPTIEKTVQAANAPRAVVGIIIAALVLLPETWAAMRAALANRLQTSMNLAVGSALACIGLTVLMRHSSAPLVGSCRPFGCTRFQNSSNAIESKKAVALTILPSRISMNQA